MPRTTTARRYLTKTPVQVAMENGAQPTRLEESRSTDPPRISVRDSLAFGLAGGVAGGLVGYGADGVAWACILGGAGLGAFSLLHMAGALWSHRVTGYAEFAPPQPDPPRQFVRTQPRTLASLPQGFDRAALVAFARRCQSVGYSAKSDDYMPQSVMFSRTQRDRFWPWLRERGYVEADGVRDVLTEAGRVAVDEWAGGYVDVL